jgi:hypothetical protein
MSEVKGTRGTMKAKGKKQEIRSEYVALAHGDCAMCHGTAVTGRETRPHTCLCVYRRIFREVYARFRYCAASITPHPFPLDGLSGPKGKRTSGFRNIDFAADFCLIAKRILTNPLDYMVFKFHFLLGAECALCCKRLGLNRGQFFHGVYGIEHKLGRAFVETKPFGLYPVAEYFGGISKQLETHPLPVATEPHPNGIPLRAPLAKRPLQADAIQPTLIKTANEDRMAMAA